MSDLTVPDAASRWRCAQCGNLTRFDVVRQARTREFWHVDLAGEPTVESVEVLSDTAGVGELPLVRQRCGDRGRGPARQLMPSRADRNRALAFAVAWLAFFTALQWSVVRFKVPIVVILTASAVALAVWQWRRARIVLTPLAMAVMLAGSALATLVVPLFSYLDGTGLAVARALLMVVPLVVAALLWSGREGPAGAALAVGVVGYVVVGAVAILNDPAPKIDVWVTLQQASDALARGVSFYEVTWVGLPGCRRRVHLPAVDGRAPGPRAVAGRGCAVGADGLDPRGGGGRLGAGGGAAWRSESPATAERQRTRAALAGGGRHRPAPVRPGHVDPGGPGVDRAAAARRGRVVGRARGPWPGVVGRGAPGPGLCQQAAPRAAPAGPARVAALRRVAHAGHRAP